MAMKLWYMTPAEDWNETLPIGNGRLGGMIFGNTECEHIQLNEDSVWYGGAVDRNNPDAFSNLPRIRKLLFEGKIKEAEKLAVLAFSGVPESQRMYQTLGDLFMEFGHDSMEVKEYTRELDLNTAIATVSYIFRGIHYKREYFASAADEVMVIRLTADKASGVSFISKMQRGRYLDNTGTVSADAIFMDFKGGEQGGVGCRSILKVSADGGRVYTLGDNLLVEGADAVTLLFSVSTSFRYADYRTACLEIIENASKKDYDTLKRRHTEDYKALFDRVVFKISSDGIDKELEMLQTDKRIERVRMGLEDHGLISCYFQYGRYLLISCSRPGTLPANLQGIWNKEMLPPWDSKYTININTEMNYWPAEVCNLAECHLPLFDQIERMREPGRRTAKNMYCCRGFVAHHNTDIWADTAPQDRYIPATFWPMGAAWLCLHLWEHYEFGKDIAFLRRAYPAMKEAAEFFTDFLIEDSKGCLVTCPSVSPENTYIMENGEKGSLCIGPSMDFQIILMLFDCCLKAAQLLDMTDEFTMRIEEMMERLPKPVIGRHGQIQEWAEDYLEAEPGHRHISNLFGLYPGNLFTIEGTPLLAEAARKTLERRLASGGGNTGWSKAWIINLWARLEDGAKAYESVIELLKKSTLTNLLNNCPPFQIDGNLGGTAGIAEMLLQSHAGEIRLLAALPHAWANGYIKGLRARGGVEVDMEWIEGNLSRVTFKAQSKDIHTIRYRGKVIHLEMDKGECIAFKEFPG